MYREDKVQSQHASSHYPWKEMLNGVVYGIVSVLFCAMKAINVFLTRIHELSFCGEFIGFVLTAYKLHFFPLVHT